MPLQMTATRFHDFCAGHRVAGHENKCAHLHGHNYRVHFTVAGDLDNVGRVMDFSIINERLCQWLEMNWDHKFLVWDQDDAMQELKRVLASHSMRDGTRFAVNVLKGSTVWVPFNPTAENMAAHLMFVVAPERLRGTGVRVVRVVVEETRKCSATLEV